MIMSQIQLNSCFVTFISNNTISLEKFDSITKIMKIADKYQFTELFDTCDSHLAQLCAFKLENAFITRRKLKHYLSFSIQMARAPKWTAVIVQNKFDISRHGKRLDDHWSSLMNKNSDFALLAAKTIRNDYHDWIKQHKSWNFATINKKEKENNFVRIVGPLGEMKNAVRCEKV